VHLLESVRLGAKAIKRLGVRLGVGLGVGLGAKCVECGLCVSLSDNPTISQRHAVSNPYYSLTQHFLFLPMISSA
jgi:hypothetical protein